MEVKVLELLKSFVHNHVFLAYAFFFISAFLQVTFPPYPGDTVIVVSGYITTMSPNYPFLPVALTIIIAEIIGSIALFKLGYIEGDKVLSYPLVKKYIPECQANQAKDLFAKYGPWAIFTGKFIPGMNMVMLVLAGIFKLKQTPAMVSMVTSTIIQNFALIFLGRFVGKNLGHAKRMLATYNRAALIIGIIVILCIVLYWRSTCKRSEDSKDCEDKET